MTRTIEGRSSSLLLGLSLYEAVEQHGPVMGIKDLAEGLSIPISTAHRYLQTFVDAGWMEQAPNRKYMLRER